MSETPRLVQAIALAVEAHKNQLDKAGMPYILHPLRVMLAVAEYNPKVMGTPTEYNEDVMIAAILHDVVEDTPVTDARGSTRSLEWT